MKILLRYKPFKKRCSLLAESIGADIADLKGVKEQFNGQSEAVVDCPDELAQKFIEAGHATGYTDTTEVIVEDNDNG